MAKTYDANWHRKTSALEGTEFPLVLLEINHADLPQPIRVVNDREDVTHNGNLYQRMAFGITLPDDPEQGLPQAKLSLDNIGRELVTWLETADWNNATTVTITQILRSDPNTVQFTTDMGLENIKVTQMKVTGDLTYEDLLGLPAININYTPQTAVGLF